MRFGDPFDDCQTQAKAAVLPRTGFIGPEKALEDVRNRFRRDSHPGIGNAQANALTLGFENRLHLAARRRVADGIVEEIHHQAAEQFLISAKLDVFGPAALDRDLAGGGQCLDGTAAIGQQVVQIEVVGLQLDVAGIGARQVEQVVHQVREAPRFVENDGERFPVLGGAANLRKGHVGFAANDSDGRAKFVGGIGAKANGLPKAHVSYGLVTIPRLGEAVMNVARDALRWAPSNLIRRVAGRLSGASHDLNRTMDDAYLDDLRELYAAEGYHNAYLATVRSLVTPKALFGGHHDVTKRLNELKIPVQLIWGANDPLFPVAHAARAHTMIERSKLAVIEGAGHTPQAERPEEFNRVLRRFLDS